MRIALDPFMHRHLGLEDLPRKMRELGYDLSLIHISEPTRPY